MFETAAPGDESLHAPTADANFNESMAFMFHEQGPGGVAGILRVGNRVNEGWAEVTALILLPDGGAAIHFGRPSITAASWQHDGLRFDVVEPLERATASYHGPVRRLARAEDLADPRQALSTSPEVDLAIDLEYRSIAPLYRLGEGDAFMAAIATDHYQGVCEITGTLEIDGEQRPIHAYGWRDHSWGPRNWQGVRFWRWVSCFVDVDNHFAGWVHGVGDEPLSTGMGVVHRRGEVAALVSMDLKSDYTEAPTSYPSGTHLVMTTEDGDVYRADGSAYLRVPLRHRRGEETTRIVEIVCEQDFDGLTGYGFSEYLDTMLDGLPAGVGEA